VNDALKYQHLLSTGIVWNVLTGIIVVNGLITSDVVELAVTRVSTVSLMKHCGQRLGDRKAVECVVECWRILSSEERNRTERVQIKSYKGEKATFVKTLEALKFQADV
jgi:hypothetical protein